MVAEIDEWEEAKYRACDCGHSLTQHRSDGTCRAMRTHRPRPADLPVPVLTCGHTEMCLCWPSNWPQPGDFPEVTEPCPCKKFYDAEPPEPDWGS